MFIKYPFSHSSIVGLGSCMDGADNCTTSLSHHRVIKVASAQEAKTFKLRTAIKLARLWLDLGELKVARDLLLPIYEWFTEGSSTPNLIEAKALPDKIS